MTRIKNLFLSVGLNSTKISLVSLLCFAMALFISFPVFAQNNSDKSWKQFRGNMRNGISTETGLLKKWPKSGPELVWKKEIGQGFSEIVVSENIAYLLAADSTKGGFEYLSAYNISSAKELWKTNIDSLYFEVDGWGHGPRATPVIDNQTIYCFSGLGKLAAYSIKDGAELWKVDFAIEFESKIPRWGFSSSPILVDDILIVETGGTKKRAFTAFDKKTGKTIWSKGEGPTTYSSPTIATIDNKTQIVFANDTMLYSYDVNGAEIWSHRIPLRSPHTMPVFIQPNKFFISMVSRVGGIIIEVNDNKASEFLTSRTMQNNFNTSCYYNGYLYGFTRTKLQCVSAETGEKKWSHRGFGEGSLILVDNKLLVLSDQGELNMIEASSDAFKLLGTVKAMEGKSWTAPSFADGKIFVRNLTEMSCYKLTK